MQTDSQGNAPLPQMIQPSINPARLFALVVVLAIVGLILVRNFAAGEEQRELFNWQNKLNLIADARAADIDGWLQRYFRDLGNLANDQRLQIYVTELESTKGVPTLTPPLEDPAQAVFLRNQLLYKADVLGFLSKTPDPLKTIHANVHPPSGTGLAIVDNSGKILVSTDGLPVLDGGLAAKVAAAPRGAVSLIDMFASSSGDTQIGFVLPIYPIQGDAVASQQIGKLVGIKSVGDDLFTLLKHPGATESTLEALLVRKEGDNVVYLSPVKDSKPLSERFALSTPALDAAFAIDHPGDFALKRDRLGNAVLMTSRPIAGSPWVMLLHIDRDQALAASDSWRGKMEWIMWLMLLAFVMSIYAAWWYGTSRRAMLLTLQTSRLAAHSLAQEKLLRLVTDNQPEPIFIADSKNIVRFANERAARAFKIAVADVAGKDLSALMGPHAAMGYTESNASALSMNKPLSRTHQVEASGGMQVLRSEHIPLQHIPIDGLPFPSPGVLVIDQDVTEIVNERERRARTLHQLIRTLVRMVDERDPFSANHSANVSMVARHVAQSMGLDPLLAETARIAGSLMNIGKIVISSKVLTKTSALGEGEVKAIRESLIRSAELLSHVDFDGPVAETLRQAPEHYDGTGPLKLKGDDILITARIIAVANAFIGMISPRSYRAAIGIDQAAKLLLEGMDKQFDRRVVVALVNFVENQQGREMLSQLALKKVG